MRYRSLGKTGLQVSEIGLGGEWLERHSAEEVKAVVDYCAEKGINILDCWMSEPNVRANIGAALEGQREKWYIQGHIGSTWQNGQYVRTRDLPQVKAAFEDLLARMRTDYIDLGMIHYVDEKAEFKRVMQGAFIEYVRGLKAAGTIRHIGLSTHNPDVARLAAEHGEIEMILFSVNPAFDMVPATENLDDYFAETYDEALGGIVPERAALYRICEQNGVGITVMKGYAGGRLFTAAQSPFGVDRRVRNGVGGGEGLRERARQCAEARLQRSVHLLRPLCAVSRRHRHRDGQQAARPREDAAGNAGLAARALQQPFCERRGLHRLRRLRNALSVRRARR